MSRIALKTAAVAAVFTGCLLYFVFANGWYAATRLIIEGVAPEPGAAVLIRWDSGEGFNDYEKALFPLDTPWPNAQAEHTIKIKRTGQHHRRSKHSKVHLYGVQVDDRGDLPMERLQSDRARLDSQGRLRLQGDGTEIEFSAVAKNLLKFQFPVNNRSGFVEISINGRPQTFDLYGRNDRNLRREEYTKDISYWLIDPEGRFRVEWNVPRYAIETLELGAADAGSLLKFKSITLLSPDSKKRLFLGPNHLDVKYGSKQINAGRIEYFHPHRLSFQILFAAVTTWILAAIYGFVKKCGGLRETFFDKKRPVFWVLFAGAISVFSIWLAAFWPGVMSIDSLQIWRAARIPGLYLNDHPVINVVYYQYLLHIWDNIAIVPIAQILLTSVLASFILFSLYRQGVPLWIIIPIHLFFITSVPIGLYNTVLWKDIPFALLVAFWAYTLSDMYRQKKAGKLFVSKQKSLALFLLYLALSLTRHNGMIYFFIVPLFLISLGIVPYRKLLVTGLILVSLVMSALMLFSYKATTKNRDFVTQSAAHYLNKLKRSSIKDLVRKTASNFLFILDIRQKNIGHDLWHYYLHDRTSYNYLKFAGWNDVYPYEKRAHYPFPGLHRLAFKIYQATYRTPWVYFSWNLFYMLGLSVLATVFFRIVPMAAIFSSFVLIQILALMLIIPINWRYFYFAVFSSYFLIPILALDIKNRFTPGIGKEAGGP